MAVPGSDRRRHEGRQAMTTDELRRDLIDAIRAVPDSPYTGDGADGAADALLPVVTSWPWLMRVLAEHYPPDVFPGGPDADPGPQIVALTRVVDAARGAAVHGGVAVDRGGREGSWARREDPHRVVDGADRGVVCGG